MRATSTHTSSGRLRPPSPSQHRRDLAGEIKPLLAEYGVSWGTFASHLYRWKGHWGRTAAVEWANAFMVEDPDLFADWVRTMNVTRMADTQST